MSVSLQFNTLLGDPQHKTICPNTLYRSCWCPRGTSTPGWRWVSGSENVLHHTAKTAHELLMKSSWGWPGLQNPPPGKATGARHHWENFDFIPGFVFREISTSKCHVCLFSQADVAIQRRLTGRLLRVITDQQVTTEQILNSDKFVRLPTLANFHFSIMSVGWLFVLFIKNLFSDVILRGGVLKVC